MREILATSPAPLATEVAAPPLAAPPLAATARPALTYPTAFLEGASVIIIEIAGARALAPFFGTSLQVWTATITVTLFFLASGYGLGGWLARRLRPATLPMLFAAAGAWLALYPLLLQPILDFTSARLGVAVGSLASAALLFGVPLLMLGAVSPVLIAYIDRRRPGAGSAAGRLFFTNTMGGLAGGWVTAFALIPHASLRMSLVSTGVGLIVLALVWASLGRSQVRAIVIVFLIAAVYSLIVNRPPAAFRDKRGNPIEVRFSHQSGIGLLQVIDCHYPAAESRQLLLNGVLQGEMNLATGRPGDDYINSLRQVSRAYHPRAATALQLGVGAGLLPSELARDGLRVTAVDIEPRIVTLARQYFGLPDTIDVHIADARTFLRHDSSKYDLIFLDTFASESTAWYLMTTEAFTEMRDRLNPGGRLLINTVAFTGANQPGMARLEASLLKVFPQARVFAEKPTTADPQELVNVTLIAGENLVPTSDAPARGADAASERIAELLASGRPATVRGPVATDDRSDLDYVEANMRVRWRTLIWNAIGSELLCD